jgi:hypothetical protein
MGLYPEALSAACFACACRSTDGNGNGNGNGKTWLTCTLAQAACGDDITVLYKRMPRFFDKLELAHAKADCHGQRTASGPEEMDAKPNLINTDTHACKHA